jgi:hypothetical protein
MDKFYIYEPVFLDSVDPKVLTGDPIKQGELVQVTKSKIDPKNLFCFVEDLLGNRQSVYKSSLREAY